MRPPPTIIVFLVRDWPEFHRRPMLEALARNAKDRANFLFVDPPLCPWVAAVFRRRRLKRWLRGPRLQGLTPNAALLSPSVWLHETVARRAGLLWYYRRLVARQISRSLRSVGMDGRDSILWVFRPEQVKWLGIVNEDHVVYECYDEYRVHSADGRPDPRATKREDTLLRHADVVLTTSRRLFESRTALHPHVIYSPNGAEVERFLVPDTVQESLPDDLRAIPPPRLGYINHLGNFVDLDFIDQVAGVRPDYSFVFIGEVRCEPRLMDRIGHRPNVFLLGGRPYDQIPRYYRGMDAVFFPIKLNRYTEHGNPLTMWEALAAGKVVVSTPFPELAEIKDVVSTAVEARAFAVALDQALARRKDSTLVQRGRSIASRHSWDRLTIDAFDKIMSQFQDGVE